MTEKRYAKPAEEVPVALDAEAPEEDVKPVAPVASLEAFCRSRAVTSAAELLSVFYEREQRAGRVQATFDEFAARLVAFAEMPLE